MPDRARCGVRRSSTTSIKGNVAGPDGAVVLTEGQAVKGSEPVEVVVASDGVPWYTMTAANKIATLQLR
jgi:streptogramin lyase